MSAERGMMATNESDGENDDGLQNERYDSGLSQ